MDFRRVGVTEQLAQLEARALDDRPAIRTGFPELDDLFHRGGLQPGTFVILGGRMHTRKTTVALNMMLRMLRDGVPVGFVSLDEPVPMYVAKLMSAMSRLTAQQCEDKENWDSPELRDVRESFTTLATNLYMTDGSRPGSKALDQWFVEMNGEVEPPRVVFIDYLSLMYRGWGKETERVQRLVEEVQVWTKERDVVTVALHQVGRQDEGTNLRYHGDTPMTAEALKHGGEEMADIVLGTYRPALNQLGQMDFEEARRAFGEKFDEEKWEDARERVKETRDRTYLQLLKNRPGTHLDHRGVELRSPDESQYIEPVSDGVTEDGVRR